MLEQVDVGVQRLETYRDVAPEPILTELEQVGRALRGTRVLHVNATPYGGGVSELLRSVVPLENALGLLVDWKIIHGDDAFFKVTKKIHNALQGAPDGLSGEEKDVYRRHSEHNAAAYEEQYDVVFIHDPQPAAIPSIKGKGSTAWAWRCHIDTSRAQPATWDFLRSYIAVYDAAIFTMAEFVPPGFPVERVEIIPPAIDPLSPKNLPLDRNMARAVLAWIGVSLDRPLIVQVSRFDPWKDPLGVIAAYRLARKEVPDLQLALVGSMALDDPEGWDVYRRIQEEAAPDRDLHVFTNLTGVGNIEVNAFQTLSSLAVQKSIREGFGLVVSETLWKGTPMVAGRAGGIPLQMADGVGGILVDDVEGCAKAIVELLKDRERAAELGRTGRERVREQFLIPRLVLDELRLVEELISGKPVSAPHEQAERDPVCGMAVDGSRSPPTVPYHGRKYVFCSEKCKQQFERNPERFVTREAGA